MKRLLLVLLMLVSLKAVAQHDLETQTRAIVDEGKQLYKSEMASWYGTDLFLSNFKDKTKIGGYFSYTTDEISKCVFFSRTDKPKIIGTISFDSSFSTESAKVDLTEREFSDYEKELYVVRVFVLGKLNSDTIFKKYSNTDFNIVPLLKSNEKKVYVLTGPKQNGVVIFGNDYLLTFDNNLNLKAVKRIHKNIVPIGYGSAIKAGSNVIETVHTHLPETGDFITASDICTLMLYEKFAKWKKHKVISTKYISTWNCETNELSVVPLESIKK